MIRALLLVLTLAVLLPGADPPPTPDTVQRHLGELKAPWYDREHDSWRRIELPEARVREPEEDERGGSTVGVGPVAWLLLAVVVAVVVMLILDLVRMWRAGAVAVTGSDPTGRPAPRPVDLSHLPFQVDESSDPEREAEEAFTAGDWTRAVVWHYVIQLIACDRAGLIHLGPGATDRGCLRQAQAAAAEGRPAVGHEVLTDTLAVFQRAYFGHVPATADEASAVRRGSQHLRETLAAEGRR